MIKKEELLKLRNTYLKGMRVRLIHMDGEKQMPSGICGTVDFVDDIGTVKATWDNGSTLGFIPTGVDNIEILQRNDRLFTCGQIVAHFKRAMIQPEELAKCPNKHLYKVIAVGVINTETNENMVVYQALYAPFMTFARPSDMAKELVDWSKYPYVPYQKRQPYRLMEYDITQDSFLTSPF